MGTTSAPSTLDPAASWDGSWELFRNVYQTLLSYPSGASEPEPDAAESCEFTDASNTHVQLQAARGHEVLRRATRSTRRPSSTRSTGSGRSTSTAAPRVCWAASTGSQAQGDREVVFHLNQSDATFPFVLATPAMSIVDPDDYPADARCARTARSSAPGRTAWSPTRTASRPNSSGTTTTRASPTARTTRSPSATSRTPATMVDALRDKEIDVTYRGLAASDIVALQDHGAEDEGLQLVEGAGTEISYLVFNPKDPWAKKPAVRKAVAQIVDRAAIAHKVYKDTVEPLYSMVPKGLTGHTTGFFDDYGDPSFVQGPADPPGGGHHRARPAHPLVHDRPLRLRDRPGVPGAQAPAGGLRPVHGHPQEPPLEDVRRGLPQGRVPGVRARLVPRLPGRRQLHRALRGRAERARYALSGAARSPTTCCPSRAARATAGPWSRSSRRPSRSSSTTPGCCRCGRASSTWRRARRSRGGEQRPRPVDDHDDVGAVPEDQLVAGGQGPLSVGASRIVSGARGRFCGLEVTAHRRKLT